MDIVHANAFVDFSHLLRRHLCEANSHSMGLALSIDCYRSIGFRLHI